MNLPTTIAITILAYLAHGCAASQPKVTSPDETAQTTFASPDEAAQSLVNAVRANDQTQIKQILGPHSDDVTSSGDDIADLRADKQFLAAYDREHHVLKGDNGSFTLDTGESDWPFPIPIAKDEKSGRWIFDTDAGKEEIINRRIGRNELEVIQVCQAIIDAEREYAQLAPNDDALPEYTEKFTSDPGKKNGLYWPTAEGESPSPLGPLVGRAMEKGYTASKEGDGGTQAYHGYYYRILTSQGPYASEGALNYIVDGKMIGGVALIAWPARYGNSGIMTFIVSHQEVVYQRDLGADTEKIASAIMAFDPGPEWKKVE